MRSEPNLRIEHMRIQDTPLGPSEPGTNWGMFKAGSLRIISSGTDYEHGWEHVSVSHPARTPTWDEMRMVKELFWDDEETVIQFHPKKIAYINANPYVLHLWRKIGVDYELPPKETIA